MDTIKKNIETVIQETVETCQTWVKQNDAGKAQFVDSIDNKEISAHYGATHAAASFIIWGKLSDNNRLTALGENLLESIISRWEEDKRLPAYHFDFNNFALCATYNYANDSLKEKIQNVILKSPDSNHETVNWLPMRWVVNKQRYKWTEQNTYLSTIQKCKQRIFEATNEDGGIEDRLPKGKSFNLQYDVATAAVLLLLKIQGEEIDLSKQIGFLLNAIAPDGDINYLGRGTNQVFAWGLWCYLLCATSNFQEASAAVEYIQEHFSIMLKNKNMMFNAWDGKEKFLWWDYHYSSVYTAHFLLWLILAWRDFGKTNIAPDLSNNCNSTGVHIFRTERSFVSWFEGRDEYLAEKGPAVAAIWSKKHGMLVKGTFGPWHGMFGNNHIQEDIVLKNYCGLIQAKHEGGYLYDHLLHKIPFTFIKQSNFLELRPVFCPVQVKQEKNILLLKWSLPKESEVFFNLPLLTDNEHDIHLWIDGNIQPLIKVGSIRNQYALCNLYQSKTIRGKNFELRINIQ